MAEIVAWDQITVCRSEAALFDALALEIAVPRWGDEVMLRESRAEILRHSADHIAHCLDGKAVERMVDLIERVAR